MTAYTIKLKGNEAALTSNSTVGNAALLRFINASAANVVITQFANTGTQVGNCTIAANGELILQKTPTDSVMASASIQVVPIAFRD